MTTLDRDASRTSMFHVKHRLKHRVVAFGALIALTLVATGCTGAVTPPKGWAPPVSIPNDAILVQSGIGRLTTVKSDGTRIADFSLPGSISHDFLGREKEDPSAPLYATPLVDGTAVYVASYSGMVTRLTLDNGTIAQQWAINLHETVVATPVLRGDRLYVSTENGHLQVLNAANGTAISASRPTVGRVWGAPATKDDRIFIGTLDSSEILALNTSNNATIWKHNGTGATAADLVIDGDTLLAPSFDRGIHSLDLATGDQKWAFTGDGWFVGRPLLTKDAIVTGTMSGSMYSLDRSGKQQWKYTAAKSAQNEFRATPILANGTVIAASRNGTFVGLNAATGAEQWTRTVDKAEVDADGVMIGNAVFYTTNDYRLLRLDPASGDIQTFNIQPPSGSK